MTVGNMNMKLWLEVSQDRYELPLMVCESAEELAVACGTTSVNIRSQISKFKSGVVQTCRYRTVVLNEKLDEVC